MLAMWLLAINGAEIVRCYRNVINTRDFILSYIRVVYFNEYRV